VDVSRFSEARVLSALALIVCGCSAQPPIVADPPQHEHAPPQEVPWEEAYSRARVSPGVFEYSGADPHQDQPFSGELELAEESRESSFMSSVADVIAFPFRGLGWLIQSLM
jgi:hypothetical protein